MYAASPANTNRGGVIGVSAPSAPSADRPAGAVATSTRRAPLAPPRRPPQRCIPSGSRSPCRHQAVGSAHRGPAQKDPNTPPLPKITAQARLCQCGPETTSTCNANRVGSAQRQCQRPDLAEDGPHFQDLTTTAVSRRSWRKALRHPWVSGIAASGSRREEGDWVMGREYVALNRADANTDER